MAKYTDLDLDHKKEFLVNLKALYLLASGLSSLVEEDVNSLVADVWKEAHSRVIYLSDDDIHKLVADLEKNRKPFVEPGSILIQ